MPKKKLNITKIIEEELQKIEKNEKKGKLEQRERLAEMIDDHEGSMEHLKLHSEEEKVLFGGSRRPTKGQS